ncbi:MAG: hypothetical protein ACOCXG_04825 [Nanoarchaeota archaeon]
MLYKKLLILILLFGIVGSVWADEPLEIKVTEGSPDSSADGVVDTITEQATQLANLVENFPGGGTVTIGNKEFKNSENLRTHISTNVNDGNDVYILANGVINNDDQNVEISLGGINLRDDPIGFHEKYPGYFDYTMREGVILDNDGNTQLSEALTSDFKYDDYVRDGEKYYPRKADGTLDKDMEVTRDNYNAEREKYNNLQQDLSEIINENPEMIPNLLSNSDAKARDQMLERINGAKCGTDGAFSALCRFFKGHDDVEEALRYSISKQINQIEAGDDIDWSDCSENTGTFSGTGECTDFNSKVDKNLVKNVKNLLPSFSCENTNDCETELNNYRDQLEKEKEECNGQNEAACRAEIDSNIKQADNALAIVDEARKKKRYQPPYFGTTAFLSALINPDPNAMRASEFMSRHVWGDVKVDSEFIQEHVNTDFASQICLKATKGPLGFEGTTQNPEGGAQTYDCFTNRPESANFSGDYTNEEIFIQDPSACGVSSQLNSFRSPMTPDNKVGIHYSFYLRAPNYDNIEYRLFAGYLNNGNPVVVNLTEKLTLQAGKGHKQSGFKLVNITNSQTFNETTANFQIKLVSIFNGTSDVYTSLQVPVTMQYTGTELELNILTDEEGNVINVPSPDEIDPLENVDINFE